MRVRMLDAVAGRPSFNLGDVADLDPALARAWIQAGIAEALRVEEAETTEASPRGERAVTRRRKR